MPFVHFKNEIGPLFAQFFYTIEFSTLYGLSSTVRPLGSGRGSSSLLSVWFLFWFFLQGKKFAATTQTYFIMSSIVPCREYCVYKECTSIQIRKTAIYCEAWLGMHAVHQCTVHARHEGSSRSRSKLVPRQKNISPSSKFFDPPRVGESGRYLRNS